MFKFIFNNFTVVDAPRYDFAENITGLHCRPILGITDDFFNFIWYSVVEAQKAFTAFV